MLSEFFSQTTAFIFGDNNYQWIFSGAAFALLSVFVAAVSKVIGHLKKGGEDRFYAESLVEMRDAKQKISEVAEDAGRAARDVTESSYEETAEQVKQLHAEYYDKLMRILGWVETKNLLVDAYSNELVKMVSWNDRMYELIRARCAGSNRPQDFLRHYRNLWRWYQERVLYVIDCAVQDRKRSKRIWSVRAECRDAGREVARQDVADYFSQLEVRGGDATFNPRIELTLKKV